MSNSGVNPKRAAMHFRNSSMVHVQKLEPNVIAAHDTFSVVFLNEDEFEKMYKKWNGYKNLEPIDLDKFEKEGKVGASRLSRDIKSKDIRQTIPSLDDIIKVQDLSLKTKEGTFLFKTENDHLMLMDEDIVNDMMCEYNLYTPRTRKRQNYQPVLYLEYIENLHEDFVENAPDYLKTEYDISAENPMPLALKGMSMPIIPEDVNKYKEIIEDIIELSEVKEFQSDKDDGSFSPERKAV